MSESVSIQPTISFNEIPYQWEVPGTYIEVDAVYDQVGVLGYPKRDLAIGGKLASGYGGSGQIYTISAAIDAKSLFGAGSQCADMAAMFFANNPTSVLDMVGLSDVAGTSATITKTIGGTAAISGVLAAYINGVSAATTIAVGDTGAVVATNFVATINGNPDLPVTAATTGSPVTGFVLTAKHVGLIGTGIDLRFNIMAGESVPKGISFGATVYSGGAGTPDIAATLAAIASTWYTDVSLGFNDPNNIAEIVAEADRRFTALGRQDMRVYISAEGTLAQCGTFLAGYNCKSLVLIPSPSLPSATWSMAAAVHGVASFQLANDPARQLRGLALRGIVGPQQVDRWIDSQREVILLDGGATFNVLRDGTVVLERVLTSYTSNQLGVPDPAFHDVMTVATASRIRYDWLTFLSLQWPRNKLSDDDSLAAEYDLAVATPRRLKASWAARCALYARLGWIEDTSSTVAASVFVRDPSNRNRVNSRLQIKVIGNLMIFAGALTFEA